MKNSYDVVIIGGGPAGISAAIWCSDLGLDAILLESEEMLGGQLFNIHNPIANYPAAFAENGSGILKLFVESMERFDIKRLNAARVVTIDTENSCVILANEVRLSYKTAILATGVSRRKLNVPGEKEFECCGVLRSGVKERDLIRSRKLVIVGGGDAALENASILKEAAGHITLIHRGEKFRAREEFLENVLGDPKIELITNAVVEGIYGGENVESVKVRNLRTGICIDVMTDFVLIRIGFNPNSELLAGKAELDSEGYVIVDQNCRTGIPGVFAVGDVASPVSQTIATAVGMGATAVKAAYDYIGGLPLK